MKLINKASWHLFGVFFKVIIVFAFITLIAFLGKLTYDSGLLNSFISLLKNREMIFGALVLGFVFFHVFMD